MLDSKNKVQNEPSTRELIIVAIHNQYYLFSRWSRTSSPMLECSFLSRPAVEKRNGICDIQLDSYCGM